MNSGMLFAAPAGTTWDEDGWLPLGMSVSCEIHDDPDPLTEALLGFDLHGHCVSVSVKTEAFSALGYWLLLRRRHPRIKAMRSAYRRKHR